MNGSFMFYRRSIKLTRALSILGVAALGGTTACGSAAPPVQSQTRAVATPSGSAAPVSATTADLAAEPPPRGASVEAPFPAITHASLPNGLELRVVQRAKLPIIEVRLVVKSGTATDGDKPGLAGIAGELLKAGGAGRFTSRALVEAAEDLGGQLDVSTDRDATSVSIGVSARDFPRALELIAAVAEAPRFDAGEFKKLKQREIERVTSSSRTSPSWIGSMVLYRELYRTPNGQHPYARYDGTPASFAKISLADCKNWHQKQFVPQNAMLVVAGQIAAADVQEAATHAFANWRGEAPPALTFPNPPSPEHGSIFVVHRPHSPQAQIYVSTLGPERTSPDFATLKTANQILGGGVSGRLFLDVRERRSLAYSTSSTVEELAHGPVPLVLAAGTQTAKAGLAVQGLLEHLSKIGSTPPTSDEVATATRYLADSFAISMETTASIANLTTRLGVFGLPDDYYDQYRKAVRNVSAPDVTRVAARYFRAGAPIIVVAGDAERLSNPLSHFGVVNVVDPEHDFAVTRVVRENPSAALAETAEAKH